MRIVLPYHLGCGNRGCEGIARGIANIYNLHEKELILYDMTLSEYKNDSFLGLDEIGELRYIKNTLSVYSLKSLNKFGISQPWLHYKLNSIFDGLTQNDYILMTGGDIYCYEGAYVFPNMIALEAKKRGIKCILYGASVDTSMLSQEAIEGLKEYTVISTRESITHSSLDKIGINNFLFPDPAFSLNPISCKLPSYFEDNNVVGINISPFTCTNPNICDGLAVLLKYINQQGLVPCFIPHVFWKGQDDRKEISKFIERMDSSAYCLETFDMSYQQIRHAISKCRFFIGGRTHAVISAYSTRVPCIALGYSIKSIGIANDLCLPDFTLVDSKSLSSKNELLDKFRELERIEASVLYSELDGYIQRSFDSGCLLEMD